MSTSPKLLSAKAPRKATCSRNKTQILPCPDTTSSCHQDGEDWDYAVINHLGTKATVDAAGTPAPAAARDLNAWHTDTFVNGPAWPEFAKAMGLDDPAKSVGSVYVVSVFRAAPGHRDELEKSLAQAPGGGQNVAGNVLMQHLEGGPLAVPHHRPLQLLAGFRHE